MSREGKFIIGTLIFFAVGGGMIFIVSGGTTSPPPRHSEASTPSRPASPYAGEVADGRSYGEVLATEMAGSSPPPTHLTSRFNRLLDSIAQGCSEDREWVADRILTGQKALARDGGDASLMDVAEGWNEAVQGTRDLSPDCTNLLATLLAMLDQGS